MSASFKEVRDRVATLLESVKANGELKGLDIIYSNPPRGYPVMPNESCIVQVMGETQSEDSFRISVLIEYFYRSFADDIVYDGLYDFLDDLRDILREYAVLPEVTTSGVQTIPVTGTDLMLDYVEIDRRVFAVREVEKDKNMLGATVLVTYFFTNPF